MDKLQEARQIINKVDKEMAKLFEERMEASKQVALFKKELGLPIEDKKREADLIELNQKYITNDEVKKYYIDFLKDTIKVSKNYQRELIKGQKIAYCGVEGAFAYIACKRLFPDGEYVSSKSFEDAYKLVEDGECDLCVLPIENSFAGDVGNVMDLVFNGSLFINQIYDLDVTHNLLCLPGAKINDIKTVISHPQALNQCADYIREHNFNTIECANTALAAKQLHDKNDKSMACIASIDTASLYDLEVLEKHINSSNTNTTRFAVFSKVLNMPQSNLKMGTHFILVFTVSNEAGSLAKTLNIIGSHGFNMRNLRSRPMKSLMWSYYFFVELEGNINTSDGEDLMIALRAFCDRLKLVGTYYNR